jgi:hypothetical protein
VLDRIEKGVGRERTDEAVEILLGFADTLWSETEGERGIEGGRIRDVHVWKCDVRVGDGGWEVGYWYMMLHNVVVCSRVCFFVQ